MINCIRATGAQMRSILLGVIEFIIVPKTKNTTTIQIAFPEIAFSWGNIKLASDKTTAAIKARMIIFKMATALIFGGYFPGYLPPIDARPQGAPAARQAWKIITIPVNALNIMADQVSVIFYNFTHPFRITHNCLGLNDKEFRLANLIIYKMFSANSKGLEV